MTKDEMRHNIRKNLLQLRISKGLTQAALADLVGKKPTAVASWEQGISLPDITTLYFLSKLYEVSMEYFYEEHME